MACNHVCQSHSHSFSKFILHLHTHACAHTCFFCVFMCLHMYTHIYLFIYLFVHIYIYIFSLEQLPNVDHGRLILEVFRWHMMTHHSRYDPSKWVIIPSQKPLPDNIEHLQETDIHAHSGVRTCNPSKWTAWQLGLVYMYKTGPKLKT
jgi:hypothetical protein